MSTMISSAIRTLEATKIFMSTAGIMHYSNMNFHTNYKNAQSMSGTLHKLSKKNKIMQWREFGIVLDKVRNSRSYGYSIFNIELLKECDKVVKIVAKLTPNHRTNVNVCFQCKVSLTYKNISEVYYDYDVFRLHICRECCISMRAIDKQIRELGCAFNKVN